MRIFRQEKAYVEVDGGEPDRVVFRRNDHEVDITFSWSGKLEVSGLDINGTVKVRADFTGRGSEHAILKFKELLEYKDDLHK